MPVPNGALESEAESGRTYRLRLDAGSFARLYQESYRVLWCAAAAIVRDRTQADDLVQQSAVTALERLEQFSPGTSFVGWMVTIVRNTALNEARKTARRRTSAADVDVLDGVAPDGRPSESSPAVDGRGQLTGGDAGFDDDLLRALGRLDETARGCLLMRIVLEMSYRDIALALSIPEGTAASHVHRARGVLREALRAPSQGRSIA